MSEAVRRKTFKYGKDVAVRLPKECGVKPGDKLEVDRTARGIRIRILSEFTDELPSDGLN
jgi:urease accessory protein UreE